MKIKKVKSMNSSVKIKTILIILGIILVIIPISDIFNTDENNEDGISKEKNSTDSSEIIVDKTDNTVEITTEEVEELKTSQSYVYKDVYTVCKKFTEEFKVEEIDDLGCYNMGDGVFHIRGRPCAPFDSSTTRARLEFGFNNPYREESGHPVSYQVKCSIRYRNWNDDDGYVRLYVEKDDENWYEFWAITGLDHEDETWYVSWTGSDLHYRNDGSMNFKIVGQSVTHSWGQQPSCKVNVNDLRVTLKYDSADIYPVGEVYAIYKKYVNDLNVWEIDHTGGTNMGDGNFHIRGLVGQVRGKNYFGFNNPVKTSYGLPVAYIVKCRIRYNNWNDDDGYVRLYVEKDNGNWQEIWARTGLTTNGDYISWDVEEIRTSSDYIRNDGSMNFKVLGSSTSFLGHPSFHIDVYDLRVNLIYIPVADAGGPYYTYEGIAVTLSASDSFDLTGNILWYRWDFENDGFWDTAWSLIPYVLYTWYDDHYGTIRVAVGNGILWEDDITSITVFNAIPYVYAGPDQTVDEGDMIGFSGSYTDLGPQDTHTIEWNFGDGSPTVTGTLFPSHFYSDNGFYVVTLIVIDDDGGVGIDTLKVTVSNVAPTVDAGVDQTVDEGDIVSFSPIVTDPGSDDILTYSWDFDNDGVIDSFLKNPTYEYGDNGVYTVNLTVTDDDGGVDSDTLTIIVNNVAPTVEAGSDQTVNEGDIVSFSGGFNDPGWLDTHTFSWDFGDGSPTVTGTLFPSHVYEVPGTYVVSLTVNDDDGGSDTDSLVVTVLDITPPISTLTIQPPYQGTEEPFFVSTATEFVLSAEDGDGLGVAIIKYRIDDGIEITHTGDLLTFTIPEKGFHTIYYYSIDLVGNVEEENSMEVIVNAVELTYTGEVSGDYSDPVLFEARLIDVATQLPISGKTIEFTIGSQTVYAVTDSNGIASVTLILDQPGGLYTVSALFAGGEEYLASSITSDFTIEKEHTYATYTGSTIVPTTADTITLRATVLDEVDGYWGDLTKVYVTFRIYLVPMDPLNPLYVYGPYMVETMNVNGVGVATVEVPNLPENSYLIQISFEPDDNNYYQGPNSDLVIITVYEPTGDFVTGGGWIEDSSENKGNFGFNVKYKKNGLPKGQAIYVYRIGDWEYIVKSNAWEGMAIVDTHAFFEAKCVVQQYNSKTGEMIWSEGNYRFRVDVWDENKDGGVDIFQIRVYDKNGLIYHEAGFEPYGVLQGGNIVIHTDKKE